MMETLNPFERAVLVLHDAFDLPHAEIADILGITEGGARQHLSRAHQRIGRQRPGAPDTADRPDRPDAHDDGLERFLAAGGTRGRVPRLDS